MKPLTFAFAIVACTGLAFAQVPATTAQVQQKQVARPGQKPQPTSKPNHQSKQTANLGRLGTVGGQLNMAVGGADDCSAPASIAGGGIFNFDSGAATTGAEGQNEAICYSFGSSAITNDIWFEWTNTECDGSANVSLCDSASFDSRLAVYPAGGCPADGSAIACNDDAPGCSGFTSELDMAVTAGSAYLIQVGCFPGASGGPGLLQITVTAPCVTTGTDGCADATPISGDGVFPFDALAATTGAEGQNEALCYSFGNSAVDNDVWFEWTCDTTGTVSVSTCGDASADTKIAAYPAGGCPVDGSSLACNDDASGCAGFTSEMSFACTAGSSYLLQVGHFPGTAGGAGNVTITQTLVLAEGETCSNPSAISGDGNFAYDTSANSTDAEGQNEAICYAFGNSAIDNDLWFEWTATVSGTVTMDTCGSTTDTKIAAFDGGACPADGAALACNDDTCGLQSQIAFSCTAGSSYLIMCGNFPGAAGGAATLNVSQASSCTGCADDCSAPEAIAGQGAFPFSAVTATTGAEGQNEVLCYSFGSSAVDNDVWFEWTANADGIATLSTCNDASADTKIAAYPAGGCPVDGSSLACNDDAPGCAGFTSEMSFNVTNGSSYLLQVGHFPGTAGGAGNLTISISNPMPPHPHDDCANAGTLVDGANLIDTTGASYGSMAASGGTAISCRDNFNDVWHSYTAAESGLVIMALCNLDGTPAADFDTVLAVFDGCGGAEVACSDDLCGLQSGLGFFATAGSTYQVNVGGWGPGDAGTGILSVIATTGVPYCNGSAGACPCGNDAAQLLPSGCVNSTSQAASLAATGSPSASASSVSLIAVGAVPGLPGVFFSGENAVNGGAGIPFGDGLRCAGFNAVRLQVTASDASGNALSTVDIAATGGVSAGDSLNYQYWYREVSTGGLCGNSHNLTNAVNIVWGA